MKVKFEFCAMALSLLLLLLTGCGMIDDLQNAEHHGGPFENNLESARAYLLTQLQEKYGIEFAVVGREDLENYGPIAGATYTCDVAPINAPEQVTTALVSQTMYQDVRDNYAVYFFKEEAEAQALQLCAETEYVQSHVILLKMPQTAKAWSADDDINDFLRTSDAYLDMKVYFDEGKTDEEYADLILDFLKKVYKLNANIKLSIFEAENDYIFWEMFNVLSETPPQLPTKEEIIEDMEIARMM